MRNSVDVTINGSSLAVESGCTVAAAISIAQVPCRISITGEKRGPLCAMGICFECRATVNGVSYTRTCQLLCEQAMDICTQ